MSIRWDNADDHGIVPGGFDLKIAGDAQFLWIVLLCHRCVNY